MATKIGQIETDKTGDATAIAGDLLSGKTAYAKGSKLVGSMINRGSVTSSLTSQGGSYTIPSGYHSGAGKVTASMTNLSAGNIKSGVSVGGVYGNFSGGASGTTYVYSSSTGTLSLSINVGFRPRYISVFIWNEGIMMAEYKDTLDSNVGRYFTYYNGTFWGQGQPKSVANSTGFTATYDVGAKSTLIEVSYIVAM